MTDQALRALIEEAFPTSWLDPLLTGSDAVLGKYPYGCPDIERVLAAVKKRLLAALAAGLDATQQETWQPIGPASVEQISDQETSIGHWASVADPHPKVAACPQCGLPLRVYLNRCHFCGQPVAAGLDAAPPLQPDYWRCRTCGCVWRDNHDDTVSLGSANQTSCPDCEMHSVRNTCEPLWK